MQAKGLLAAAYHLDEKAKLLAEMDRRPAAVLAQLEAQQFRLAAMRSIDAQAVDHRRAP